MKKYDKQGNFACELQTNTSPALWDVSVGYNLCYGNARKYANICTKKLETDV